MTSSDKSTIKVRIKNSVVRIIIPSVIKHHNFVYLREKNIANNIKVLFIKKYLSNMLSHS